MVYVKYRNVEKCFISQFGCIRYTHLGDIFCHCSLSICPYKANHSTLNYADQLFMTQK